MGGEGKQRLLVPRNLDKQRPFGVYEASGEYTAVFPSAAYRPPAYQTAYVMQWAWPTRILNKRRLYNIP